jgi:PAS domain-containing protein
MTLILPPLHSYDDFQTMPIRTVLFILPTVGSILWSFGFIIMVNQRLNAENLEEKQKLQMVFNMSPDAKSITRLSDGVLVDVNVGFLAMTGYAREEILGSSILETAIQDQAQLISVIYDITDRKLAEQKIRNLLAEKELILKEVHHRIKNNMATIHSLLSLQAASLKDPVSITALEDAGSRIQSMMMLYETLYKSSNFMDV